ncbi:MAG: hypothetical protein JNL50_08600 [Phycisphaerae bacterium]|nr:hypothetical protein [Phycisphaerae bacterium]
MGVVEEKRNSKGSKSAKKSEHRGKAEENAEDGRESEGRGGKREKNSSQHRATEKEKKLNAEVSEVAE